MKLKLLLPALLIFTTLNTRAAADYTMTYLYGGTSVTYSNYLERTGGVIGTISPDYFVISDKGDLIVQKVDARFTDRIHELGMRIVPFLSNNWDKPSGIAGLNNLNSLAQQTRAAVVDNNLDGVNVDIQNVSHLYKDSYTEFVRLLRELLPDNKEVSVAVAANPNGWTLGWHGSYDYAKLAEHSDYLMMMTYDESYFGSAPGPVASKDFVEGSIKYALKHTTPDKLVLGIPFYGRYWENGNGGNALTSVDVENLMESYPSSKEYVEEKQSAKVSVTVSENDIKPKLWGGRILGAGTYEIWYEDLRSLSYRLDMARQYSLRGTGSWALGQEDVGIWEVYREFKKPESGTGDIPIDTLEPTPPPTLTVPFDDVENHWAKQNIADVYDKGWMIGAGRAFAPNTDLTRAEAATIVMNVTNLPPATVTAHQHFGDIAGHWAYDAIVKARLYGFIEGADGYYRPNHSISREEFAVLAGRVFHLSESVTLTENQFTDVVKTIWSYNSITLLAENEIITGYPDGTFRPGNSITRAEVAAILSRLTGYGIRTPDVQEEFRLQLPR